MKVILRTTAVGLTYLLLDDDEEEDDGIEVVEDGVGDDGDGVGREEAKQEIDPLGNKPLTDDLNQQGEKEKATVVEKGGG
jgi:hypothetical protein